MVIKYLLVAGAGISVGYFIAQTRLEKQYYIKLSRETDEARDFYRRKYKDRMAKEAHQKYSGDVPVEPKGVWTDFAEGLENEKTEVEVVGELAIESPVEVFQKAQAEVEVLEPLTNPVVKEKLLQSSSYGKVQYDKISAPAKAEKPKVEKTPPTGPHVITAEEFIKGETGYKQRSVTYYAGDDILAGESENVVEESIRMYTLGKDILQQLKDGLGGANIIYVRSPEAGYEFEIARSTGKYSVEVLNETG